jgi:hypothetical protein
MMEFLTFRRPSLPAAIAERHIICHYSRTNMEPKTNTSTSNRRGVLIFTTACCGLFAFIQMMSAQEWTQASAPSNYWQCVASSADGTLLAAGINPGKIFISTNSGATWQASGSPSANWYSLAASADGQKLIAGISSGPIYISTNSGTTWTQNTNLPFGDWRGIACSADGKKLAAAIWNGRIYTSANGGASWTTNALPPAAWVSLVSSADGNTLAVGIAPSTHPFVLASTNSGETWISNSLPFYCGGVAISADGRKLVAAVLGGGIYASTNSGNKWFLTGAPARSWRSVAGSADGSMILAVENTGSSGQIYTSTNSGTTWISNNVAGHVWNAGVISADGGNMVAVAANIGFATGPIYFSQTVSAPKLNLRPSDIQVALAWLIPSAHFVLQRSSSLASWSDVTSRPILNLTNLHNEITLPSTNSRGFYRLVIP